MKFDRHLIPLPSGDSGKTIGEVQEALREQLALGEQAACSCCGGTAKVYARQLNKLMIRALRRLVAGPLTPREMSMMGGGGDAAKLSHWGLAILNVDPAPHKSKWMITPRGREFLAGRLLLPHRVILYQNIVLGFDESKLLSISDIKQDFDLDRDVLSASAVRDSELSR